MHVCRVFRRASSSNRVRRRTVLASRQDVPSSRIGASRRPLITYLKDEKRSMQRVPCRIKPRHAGGSLRRQSCCESVPLDLVSNNSISSCMVVRSRWLT
eukprot:6189573-Pleurochrysis_carterae.AAC.1